MSKKNILLFGSGYMAEEYLKVLTDFNCNIFVVGRNKEKAVKLAEKYKAMGFGGGVGVFNDIDAGKIDLAIIASSIDSLSDVSCASLDKGIKNILVEKPGALDLTELRTIRNRIGPDVNFRVAYNRRFYNSVIMLKKKIEEDGGPVGCFFDFTDRQKDIFYNTKSEKVVKRWGFANSSHVIDTAFYLIGFPSEINSSRAGSWECHPSGNVFVGCGRTQKCLFSYFTTWAGGGRWSIELSTKKGRYKLSPMEELSFCSKDQFVWEKLDPQDDDDKRYKPGLYKMVKSVLADGNYDNLTDLDEQIEMCKIINRIFGYED